MTDIRYRPLLAHEIPEAVDVFTEAQSDLTIRLGGTVAAPNRPAREEGYRHLLETGIFHVAEQEGRIMAVCAAVVRDSLWFLSGFWTRPHAQRRGIGGPLLRQVWEAGKGAGASTFFVWASNDPTAMASYMKLGMMPGHQILVFGGAVRHHLAEGDGYTTTPLTVNDAGMIDLQVRGTARPVDHHFWLHGQALLGRQVLYEGTPIGYYYVDAGRLGASAWVDPRHAEGLMALALREASGHGQETSLFIPGSNHDAIRLALNAGLHYQRHSHFLTTAPFGRMERYLASGALLY